MKTAVQILEQYWGYSSFRHNQEAIIQNVLLKKDTLAILPTGGGKSICYQIPALMLNGICIIFTPLISLMKDQVLSLSQQNISSLEMHSGLSPYELDLTYSKAISGSYKFLFVAPERLSSPKFLDLVENLDISLVVVDEAHCISQWGYDFRPSYLKIGEYRNLFQEAPILALTASAIPEVQTDICKKLEFVHYKIFKSSIVRPNIKLVCTNCESKNSKVLSLAAEIDGTLIIYCKNRGTVNMLAEYLNQHGHSAIAYHAGLTHKQRNDAQDKWMQQQARIACCTNAFGMGINKTDVRAVIHFDAPDSLEAYYQEVGRAGRDGAESWAITLYQNNDIEEIETKVLKQYPHDDAIFNVYDKLCQYLKINLDEGAFNYFTFDLTSFIKSQQLDMLGSINALKIIEQEEYIQTTENIYIPSRIRVLSNHADISFLEKHHPNLDDLIKTILRLYASVLHNHVNISVQKIAQFLELDYATIIQRIEKLQQLGFVDYIPAKEKPQIWLLEPRVRHYDFKLNIERLHFLRNRFRKQLMEINQFIFNSTTCRMQQLAIYFGEKQIEPCTICDNCMTAIKKTLNQETFNNLHLQIIQVIKENKEISISQLMKQITTSDTHSTMEVIKHLISENKLSINIVGIISINE